MAPTLRNSRRSWVYQPIRDTRACLTVTAGIPGRAARRRLELRCHFTKYTEMPRVSPWLMAISGAQF